MGRRAGRSRGTKSRDPADSSQGQRADFSSETGLAVVKGPSWLQSEEGTSLRQETGLALVRVRDCSNQGSGTGRPSAAAGNEALKRLR